MPEYDDELIRSNDGLGETFSDVLERALSRRQFIKGTVLGAAMVAVGARTQPSAPLNQLSFQQISPSTEDKLILPDGYKAQVVLKWGDPIFKNAPRFDPQQQTAEKQAQQFGYNCDFVAFFPLPLGSNSSTRGVLAVNHEYTNNDLIFEGADFNNPSKEMVDVFMQAHGMSLVELQSNESGDWSLVADSKNNRRISMTTEFILSGPVAGHEWVRTKEDPTGLKVIGTLNNCAGGKTPWGTVLSGEENFQSYFSHLSKLDKTDPKAISHERYGIATGEAQHKWSKYYDRFDVSKEPNEPFRFGWVIEADPYDPSWKPKKRTTLGRMRHEACTFALTKDGRVAFYTGDDARFEYVYKFVTEEKYNHDDRKANRDLLDKGTLYVAKFKDDGTGEWMPLVYGFGPLNKENGFDSQARVLIETRRAADLLGATKMDRPEDIEPNPVNKKVYVVCTNNSRRGVGENPKPDPANPRPDNRGGHIIELTEKDDDYAATEFVWSLLLVCGDPKDPTTYFSGFPKEKVSPIACPDNIAFDNVGHLWIATDGAPSALKMNDGLFATPLWGPERGYVRQFFSSVPGSEVCGPEFTPDNTTLFLAIQHPGDPDEDGKPPVSRWPDGGGAPPRPSVIAIRAEDGSPIGRPKAPASFGFIGKAMNAVEMAAHWVVNRRSEKS